MRSHVVLGSVTKPIAVFVDGASRGNPGPASVGIVFQDKHGNTLKTISKAIGIATNNTAEYTALILALQDALMQNIKELTVFTDSELVAKQFSGEYKVKEPNIKVLFLILSHLRQGFKNINVTHVPREKNKLADEAANNALDAGQFFL